MQKINLQVIAFSRKSQKYNSYKGVKGRIAPNRIKRRFHCSQSHQNYTTTGDYDSFHHGPKFKKTDDVGQAQPTFLGITGTAHNQTAEDYAMGP